MTVTDQDQRPQQVAGISGDLAALYERTRARMGDEDLAHIRRVAAYSRAIKERSRELLQEGGSPNAVHRGAVLYGLHMLLEFAELGHNILHGSYDELPGCDEIHSDRWVWDINVDVREWKVMHHQNHHPFANIVEKDHDLGYSVMRLQPGQEWLGHHVAQLAWVPAVLASHLYYFGIYTAVSAARTEGRKVLRPGTLKAMAGVIGRHIVRDYVTEPAAAGNRFLHTMIGNHLGTTFGTAFTGLLVAIEHHAPNTEVFHDPGPDETPDQYYERQLRATTNFVRNTRMDAWLQSMLFDVDFPDPPGFEVFYGGLDTHVEHHLFPDLPPNRQREISAEVIDLCVRHRLPYNVIDIGDLVPLTLQKLATLALPVGEREDSRPWRLLTKPFDTATRLAYGALYRRHPQSPYIDAPKFFDARARVVGSRPEAGGEARSFTIAKPAGWNDITWDAGAFISLRVAVGAESFVRQYSLVRDSSATEHFEICVKRVAGGRVSNHLNDVIRRGMSVTLVGPPTSEGEFVMRAVPERALYIAGGVGITPIISMLRKSARDESGAGAVLLYFNRDAGSIIFEREIHELAAKADLRVVFLCDSAPAERTDVRPERISRELVQSLVPDLADREVYVCAPAAVVDLARAHCRDLGLPSARFHTESFAPPALARPVEGAGERYRVRFRRSAKEVEIDGCTTLLEAARAAGIDVLTGCEQGLCRACVTGKLRGTTQHDEAGAHLARVTVCNSLARSDVDLDL